MEKHKILCMDFIMAEDKYPQLNTNFNTHYHTETLILLIISSTYLAIFF